MNSNLLNKNALYGANTTKRRQIDQTPAEQKGTQTPTQATTMQPWYRYYLSLNGSPAAKTDWQTAEQKVQATAAALNVPQTTPAADPGKTTTDAQAGAATENGYYEWLMKHGLSEMSGAGMSYADYLKRTGTDTGRDYQKTVRQAETDFAKARATYGASGETLARNGMNASGYADYITGAGYAAMQGAKVAAADTKALADSRNAASYYDYLTGVQSQATSYNNSLKQSYADYVLGVEAEAKAANRELGTYINSLASDGADAATIRARAEAYAKANGYTLPDNIDDIISSSTAAYSTTTPAEQTAAETTEQVNIQEIINSGVSADLTGAQIRQQLEQAGYSSAAIEREMANYTARYNMTLSQQLARAETLEDIKSNKALDLAVSEGNLTAEQAKALKAGAAQKRLEIINKYFDLAATDEEMTQGIDAARLLYADGDLSDDEYGSLIARVGRDSVEAVVERSQKGYTGDDKISEPVVELLDQYNAVANNRKYYKDVGVQAIQKEIGDSITVSAVSPNIDDSNTITLFVDISSNDNQTQEKITAVTAYNPIPFQKTVQLKQVKQAAKAANEQGATGLVVYNDKLMYFDGRGMYIIDKISNSGAGSKENAEALMNILRSKATVISEVSGAASGAIKGGAQ